MLSKLEIKGTRDTPQILFDQENNIFEISGNSLPEDTNKFYMPVFEWISEYLKSPNKLTHLVCRLEYFNSSSAKMLYELFFELEKIHSEEEKAKISWHFEPGDNLIEEKGLEYKSIVKVPFELIEKE